MLMVNCLLIVLFNFYFDYKLESFMDGYLKEYFIFDVSGIVFVFV